MKKITNKSLPLLAIEYANKTTNKHMEFLQSQKQHAPYDYGFRIGSERGYIAGYLQALKDHK